MRAYIDVKLDTIPDTFVLSNLVFSDSDKEVLVSGMECETGPFGEIYGTRWKGVEINGTECNRLDELMAEIRGKKLTGLSAYTSDGTSLKISIVGVSFVDFSEQDYTIPEELITKEITIE